MCGCRKYPYPQGFLVHSTPWKFQFSIFTLKFWLLRHPSPSEFPMTFLGVGTDIFWNCTILVLHLVGWATNLIFNKIRFWVWDFYRMIADEAAGMSPLEGRCLYSLCFILLLACRRLLFCSSLSDSARARARAWSSSSCDVCGGLEGFTFDWTCREACIASANASSSLWKQQ